MKASEPVVEIELEDELASADKPVQAEQANEPRKDAAARPPEAPEPKHTDRSHLARENLEKLIHHAQHARRDADQMMKAISALEVDAALAQSLREENESLRAKLDDAMRENVADAAKAQDAFREINRLKDEITRIRADHEKSQREASASRLEAERTEDRLRAATASLNDSKRDLEMERVAREKAEVDAACLRANMAERDRVQNNLIQQETELRMQVAKLQTQYDEVTETLTRKERSILEKTSQAENLKDRIADLETDNEASREELRVLTNKYSDLKVSQESRIYSLNDGLNQERDSHQMTRKLLNEARDTNERLADEVATLKVQEQGSFRDQQKAQRELEEARTQLREYGDKLKEAHLRMAAGESDIQRLENALDNAKKDAGKLRGEAGKVDQLLRENTDLHQKVASLQDRLDRNRSDSSVEDIPLMLSNAKRSTEEASTLEDKPKQRVTSNTHNVARIVRR